MGQCIKHMSFWCLVGKLCVIQGWGGNWYWWSWLLAEMGQKGWIGCWSDEQGMSETWKKDKNFLAFKVLNWKKILFCRIIVSLMLHGKGNKLSDMAMKMASLNCQTWILKKTKKHLCHEDHLGPEWNVFGRKRTCSFMGRLWFTFLLLKFLTWFVCKKTQKLMFY